MKRIIICSLLLIFVTACGGDTEPVVEEAPAATAVLVEVESETDAGSTGDGTENSGSVSDAVIDTSIDTADSIQQAADELLAAGRVVVGDAGGDEAESARAVSLATSIVEVSDFLALNPTWRGVAFDQNEYYSIELRAEGTNERLGRVTVNVESDEVLGYFVPRELTTEEFAAGSEIIESYVFGETLVTDELGDLSAYESEIKYRRMEGIWEIHFIQGNETVVIPVDNWEERYFIDDIYTVVTPETADENQQAAITLARTANGVEEDLSGRSDYQIYIAPQEGDVYAVSFTTPDRELFYIKADIATGELLEAVPGFR